MTGKRKVAAFAYIMGVSTDWCRRQLELYGRHDVLVNDNCTSCNDTEIVTDVHSEALGETCHCTIWGMPNVLGDN